MNNTIDLDSSNEGENVSPNIELIIPKREKGTGEKLGDTIELSSDDEESEISITEEKKPILKRSKAAFNSTKNDTLPRNGVNSYEGEFQDTPYQTPKSSTPATAYKSVVTSTPAETPLSKLSYDLKLSEEINDDDENDLSIDNSSEDSGSGSGDSSSTTEEADEKQNSINTDDDSTENMKSFDDKSQDNEKSGVTTEDCDDSRATLDNSIVEGNKELSHSEIYSESAEHSDKEELEKEEKEIDSSQITKTGVDEGNNIPDKSAVSSLLNKEEGKYISRQEDKKIEGNDENNEIKQEKPKRLELSTSGEESDIEDDLMAKESDSPCNLTLPSKKRRLEDSINLPETCTLLRTKSGGRVYVVGTAHFSQESQVDVATVIQTVQPDIVVLELCKDRTNILHLDEETVLEEAKNLTMDKMLLAIRQNGTIQGVMYLLLLSMSAHLTKELGMAPGGEFRRAFREAHSVPGCLVHLGDRPINVTLKRALGSLSFWQKLKLGINILTSKDNITKEDVEKCKQKDLLESMLEEMAGEFPALSRVFVQERDLYLAHSLKLAANRPFGHHSSPSRSSTQDLMHESPVVVGVVGIGHVPGIIQNWESVQPEDVAKVLIIPPMSKTERFTRTVIRTTFLGLTLYTGYKLLKGPLSKAISFANLSITRA